jgi:8-oxo-dGTP pyrophosphatase MutT (NUDIX family)
LPLIRGCHPADRAAGKETFSFLLIKRSSRVSQAGDLGCPGGMQHPLLDRLLHFLVPISPSLFRDTPARLCLRQQPAMSRRLTTLFLATALREAWEEIRLPPWRIRFLGTLPTCSLALFHRTIFPLAGFVDRPVTLRPNREVERIVEIPLSSFFQTDRIGSCTFSFTDPAGLSGGDSSPHPCLIHTDQNGGEEILWGATFQIIVNFLSITLAYRLPDWTKGPAVRRVLRADYLSGC